MVCSRRSAVVPGILVFCLLLFTPPAQAQNTIFFEGFDGAYQHTWTSTPGLIPTETTSPLTEHALVTHVGPFSDSFSFLGDSQCLVMNTVLAAQWSRYGMVADSVFPLRFGTVEARINTLDQGGANIDGLFELWLFNASDHSLNVHVGLFGDNYDSNRSWLYTISGSEFPLVGPDTLPPLGYESNAWYRVRITQLPGLPLHVSVWTDDGLTELVSHDFDVNLESIGSAFQVGISQWMGGPDVEYSMLCAIDFVRVTAAYSGSDINGDGLDDLLLQNQDDGRVALFSMSGAKLISSRSIVPTLPANLRVAGVGDFDGDGRNEIVVQNTVTRAVSILFLNGTAIKSSVPVNPTLPEGWQVLAAADINDDHKPDLIVQNTSTYQIAALTMDGTHMVKSRSFSKSPYPGWKVVGAADLDGDGKTDLVVQNAPTRQISVLTLDGQVVTGSYPVTPKLPIDWVVCAVGDYDGDGKADLVVQNTQTRQIATIGLSGWSLGRVQFVSSTPPADWLLVGPK